MKKVILSAAVAALAATGAQAQQIRYGLEIGAHLGNLVQEIPNPNNGSPTGTLQKDHIDARPNLGLRAGLVADIGVSDNFSIQPGLQFVMKGARNEFSLTETNASGREFKTQVQDLLNINYIELPINVQYKTREDGTGFFVGAGPYVGYAFSGKRSLQTETSRKGGGLTDSTAKTQSDDPLDFGDNAGDDIKNLDVGIGLNVGYMLPAGAFVRGYGQYSFSNIYPVAESDYETKNYGFGITLGYMFGGKKGMNGQDDPNSATD